MRYQTIQNHIWNGENFQSVTSRQQLLFLYILTCPYGNLLGMFVLKKYYILEDLKYDSTNHFLLKNDPRIDDNSMALQKTLSHQKDHSGVRLVALQKSLGHQLDNSVVDEVANPAHKRRRLRRSFAATFHAIDQDLNQLMTKNLVQYDAQTSLVYIPNFLKYNPIRNPNQRKAALRQLEELPQSPLIINNLDRLRTAGITPGESFLRSVQAQSITESVPELIAESIPESVSESIPESITESITESVSKPESESETESETETPSPSLPLAAQPYTPTPRGVCSELPLAFTGEDSTQHTIAPKGPRRRSSKKHEQVLVDPLFNEFWKAYPKKTGKGRAMDAWGQIKPPPTPWLVEKMKKTIAETANSVGAIPMSIPAAVAIPFPPLKPAKIVHTCPTIAAPPQKSWIIVKSSNGVRL